MVVTIPNGATILVSFFGIDTKLKPFNVSGTTKIDFRIRQAVITKSIIGKGARIIGTTTIIRNIIGTIKNTPKKNFIFWRRVVEDFFPNSDKGVGRIFLANNPFLLNPSTFNPKFRNGLFKHSMFFTVLIIPEPSLNRNSIPRIGKIGKAMNKIKGYLKSDKIGGSKVAFRGNATDFWTDKIVLIGASTIFMIAFGIKIMKFAAEVNTWCINTRKSGITPRVDRVVIFLRVVIGSNIFGKTRAETNLRKDIIITPSVIGMNMKKTKTKTPPMKTNFSLELSVLTAVIAFLNGNISNFGLAVPNMTFRIVETIGMMNDMIFPGKPFCLRAWVVVNADIINFGCTNPEMTFRITIAAAIMTFRAMVPFLPMPKMILPSWTKMLPKAIGLITEDTAVFNVGIGSSNLGLTIPEISLKIIKKNEPKVIGIKMMNPMVGSIRLRERLNKAMKIPMTVVIFLRGAIGSVNFSNPWNTFGIVEIMVETKITKNTIGAVVITASVIKIDTRAVFFWCITGINNFGNPAEMIVLPSTGMILLKTTMAKITIGVTIIGKKTDERILGARKDVRGNNKGKVDPGRKLSIFDGKLTINVRICSKIFGRLKFVNKGIIQDKNSLKLSNSLMLISKTGIGGKSWKLDDEVLKKDRKMAIRAPILGIWKKILIIVTIILIIVFGMNRTRLRIGSMILCRTSSKNGMVLKATAFFTWGRRGAINFGFATLKILLTIIGIKKIKFRTKTMGLRAAKPDLIITKNLVKIFAIEKMNGMERAMGKNSGLIEGGDWGSKGKDGIKNFGNSKLKVDLIIFDTIIGIKSQGLRKSLMKGEK